MEASYQKTGYLTSDFQLFSIQDQRKKTFDLHYHDFHKILIFLQGNISYAVEGRQYDLQPGDIVLVQAGELHRPLVHDESVYERIILYLSSGFFDQYRQSSYDLFRCFRLGTSQNSSLIRISAPETYGLDRIFKELSLSARDENFAARLYQQSKIIEFLILLNRVLLKEPVGFREAVTANPTVINVLKYINDHLGEETLSVDTIAQAAFLTRSYLMHLFKAETGYTIGKYIAEKRLFHARSLIASGLSVTDACYRSGFKNYTAFYYAYRRKYHAAPTDKLTAPSDSEPE